MSFGCIFTKLISDMKYLFYISACLIFLLSISCRRPGAPDPKICSSKTSYVLADTIKLENCSKRYTKQRWLLPDGSQSTSGNIFFKAPSPGSYQFRLFVSDEDFVNEYEAIYTAVVNP